jgi:hypothetical protein
VARAGCSGLGGLAAARRALAPLPLSAAFSLLGLLLGPLSSLPLALLGLLLLHILSALRLRELPALARAALRAL